MCVVGPLFGLDFKHRIVFLDGEYSRFVGMLATTRPDGTGTCCLSGVVRVPVLDDAVSLVWGTASTRCGFFSFASTVGCGVSTSPCGASADPPRAKRAGASLMLGNTGFSCRDLDTVRRSPENKFRSHGCQPPLTSPATLHITTWIGSSTSGADDSTCSGRPRLIGNVSKAKPRVRHPLAQLVGRTLTSDLVSKLDMIDLVHVLS